jgi:hypothetical protein
MPIKIRFGIIAAVVISLLIYPLATHAELIVTDITNLFIDTPTLARGYTVTSSNEKFFVGIRPEVLAVETRVVLKQYPKDQFTFPEGLSAISDVYEFDIFIKVYC